jgi:hypothetical protein
MLQEMATHAAFAFGHTEAKQLLRTPYHFWVFYKLCSGKVIGPFLRSFSMWFLVSFLCPCDETIPGWSRYTREFVRLTYQRWRTAWKIDYRARQLTSSSGRERLSGSALARQVDGAWGVPFICHHVLQTWRTWICTSYLWRYVGNQAVMIMKQYARNKGQSHHRCNWTHQPWNTAEDEGPPSAVYLQNDRGYQCLNSVAPKSLKRFSFVWYILFLQVFVSFFFVRFVGRAGSC